MDEIDTMLVSVRADTNAFARDVAAMRASLDGPLQAGADKAGRAIEASLLRAIRTGKLGFEDLKRSALSVLAEIAAAAVSGGIDALFGKSGGGGIGGTLIGALGGLLGLPGRATGGPVSPGRAYVVGERGPEVFVPTASGQVAVPGGSGREVRVAITINAGPGEAAGALAKSSRQVARAVRAAVEGAG